MDSGEDAEALASSSADPDTPVPLSSHTGSYKTLPRALFILELVDGGLSLLLRFGISYPDNPETGFSVLVFNPYEVSSPHFPSHSG